MGKHSREVNTDLSEEQRIKHSLRQKFATIRELPGKIREAKRIRLSTEDVRNQILFGNQLKRGALASKDYQELTQDKQSQVIQIIGEECEKQDTWSLRELVKLGKKIEDRLKAEVYA